MILDKWMTGLFLIVSSSYWDDPERVLEYRPLFWNTILCFYWNDLDSESGRDGWMLVF